MSTNILLNKTAAASDYIIPFTPNQAVNGNGTDSKSRWLCRLNGSAWISVDAGATYWTNRYVVKFMGNAGWTARYNMPNFTFQASTDNSHWINIDAVSNNSANVVDRTLTTTFSARYFRIIFSSGASINPVLASLVEFEVYDAPAPDGLIGLTISSGTLTPSFANQTLNYTASVDTDTASVTLTPTSSVATATITVDGAAVTSGSASQAISLTPGTARTIPIVVTTNNVAKTYSVVVMRQTSAYLTGIKLTGGRTAPVMTPSFARNTLAYTATASATPITVSIKKEDDAATLLVTCNGTILTAGSPTTDGIPYSAPLSTGSNALVIKVTSTTGDVKNYTITITK
jgi:hypothetical protein